MRVVGLTTFMVVALGFSAGFAKADVVIGGGNGTTGAGTDNQNTWDISHSATVDINNNANASNSQEFSVMTGHTSLKDNTKVSDLFTGNITGDIQNDNHLNNGDIQLMSMDPGNVSFIFGNGTTGAFSENTNTANIDVSNNVDLSNTANIGNTLGLDANTGHNHIYDNTLVGDVNTGNIHFSASSNNSANTNAGSIDLAGMGGFNVSGNLTNNLTGFQSTNTNTVNVDANSSIDVNNNANINNTTSIDANSGDNSIGHNTVVGDISTGSVSINVSSTNVAN